MSSSNQSATISRTKGYLSVGDCFPSIFNHHNVPIKDTINRIDLSIAAESSWSSLNEVKIFIGQENPTFMRSDLLQDSARTWVIFDDRTDSIEIDELHVNGNGNLAFASNHSMMKYFTAGNLVGDYTGMLHVGPGQNVSVLSAPNSIIATSVSAYKVSSHNILNFCIANFGCISNDQSGISLPFHHLD